MLQFCGRQAQTPYYISAIGCNVYSLEEINYFIYNHMNMVYRDFFDEPLFAYIDEHLRRPDMAADLRKLDSEGAPVQDFITYILKESNYYSAPEMNRIAPLLTNINNLSRPERLKLEADALFKDRKYSAALRIYFEIMGQMEGSSLNESFFARTAFSIGMVYAHLFMSKNANAYFDYAYDLYPDPTYAKASVYMSIINNDEEELLKSIIRYNITDEALEAIREKVNSLRRSIETDADTINFIYRFENGLEDDNIIETWKEQYHERTS